MKSNNEKNVAKETYVSPLVKEFNVKLNGLLCISYGDENRAANDLYEDPDRIYDL